MTKQELETKIEELEADLERLRRTKSVAQKCLEKVCKEEERQKRKYAEKLAEARSIAFQAYQIAEPQSKNAFKRIYELSIGN